MKHPRFGILRPNGGVFMYDIIIIGGGPAGLTAAIYTKRAGFSTLLLEGGALGGQAATTPEIENLSLIHI